MLYSEFTKRYNPNQKISNTGYKSIINQQDMIKIQFNLYCVDKNIPQSSFSKFCLKKHYELEDCIRLRDNAMDRINKQIRIKNKMNEPFTKEEIECLRLDMWLE